MSTIGNLVAGGIKTFDLSYLPQFVQTGEAYDDLGFNNLTIICRGKTLVQLSDQNQIKAIMQIENNLQGANTGSGVDVRLMRRLYLADGRIEGQSTITFNQASLSTANVYANSLNKSPRNMARQITVVPVVASGNVYFKDFDYLLLDPASVERVQVTYENGFQEELNPAEISGMYASINPTDQYASVEGFYPLLGYRAPQGFRVKSAIVYASAFGNSNVVTSTWTAV